MEQKEPDRREGKILVSRGMLESIQRDLGEAMDVMNLVDERFDHVRWCQAKVTNALNLVPGFGAQEDA